MDELPKQSHSARMAADIPKPLRIPAGRPRSVSENSDASLEEGRFIDLRIAEFRERLEGFKTMPNAPATVTFGNDFMLELAKAGTMDLSAVQKAQMRELMEGLREAQRQFEPVSEVSGIGPKLFNPFLDRNNAAGAGGEGGQAPASSAIAGRSTPSPRTPHSGFAAPGKDKKGGSPGGAAAGIGKRSLAPVEEEGSPLTGGAGILAAAKNLIAGLFAPKDDKGKPAPHTIHDAVNQEHQLYEPFNEYCKAHYAAESMGYLRRIDRYLAEQDADVAGGLADEILQQSGAAVAKLEVGLRDSVGGGAGGASVSMTLGDLPRPSQGEVNLSSVLKKQLSDAYAHGPTSRQMKAAVQESRHAICHMLEVDVFQRFLNSREAAAKS